MKRLPGFSVLVLTILLLTRLHATTDEIRVVRGTAFQPLFRGGDLSVQGTSGLSIDATTASSSEVGGTWIHCDNIPACLPGRVLDIGSSYSLATLRGQVTIRGKTYALGDASLQLTLDGAIVLPEFTDDVVEVTAPFTLSGSLRVPSRHEPGTFEVFELQGSGVATVTLSPNPFFFMGWLVSNVTYEFETGLNVTQP